MKIVIFGTGYVGLVTGACLASTGVQVICVDIDAYKIHSLRDGLCPIHEKNLQERLEEGIRMGTLSFTVNAKKAIKQSEAIFITVGTPSGEKGEANLNAVFQVARTIGRHLEGKCVVVQKSTVPVGTGDEIQRIIEAELLRKGQEVDFQVVSNPEFLKEGNAILDFESPDRVIIGTESPWAEKILCRLYRPFMRKTDRIIIMGRRSAEATKYAANVMLANRISFMNLLARFAEEVNADINDIRKGIGSDKRIGPDFLFPGVGFGGSCFPKDVRALVQMMLARGIDAGLFREILAINISQRQWFFDKITKIFPRLEGKWLAVWGLAFKAGTDDVREAPSLEIIESILKAGGAVAAYDPVAMKEFKANFGKREAMIYAKDQYQALEGCDALVILTDDKRFRNPNFERIKDLLKQPQLIFDGRNLFDPKEIAAVGIKYICVGR